ncbi:MAG: hypothetical protein OD811_00510 [Alphaproteobacteria bacterium]
MPAAARRAGTAYQADGAFHATRLSVQAGGNISGHPPDGCGLR